jgi:hypothetical protein
MHSLPFFYKLTSRSSFAKQTSNLWHIKQQLQERLDHQCYIVDSFPMTTAHFERANESSNFKGEAGYGFCASKSETYYSFKEHLLINDKRNIANLTLTQALGSKREAVWEWVRNKK